MNLANHFFSILTLPLTVTTIIPAIILSASKSIAIEWGLSAPLNLLPLIVGAGVIALGLALMVKTIALFATIGKGTLAVSGAARMRSRKLISGCRA